MQSFISSSPSKKQLQKSTSAKKMLKQLLNLCIVPNTLHATTNQAYSTYYSRSVESYDKDNMYAADLGEKGVYTSKERSVELSVNDNNSAINVDDPMCDSKHKDFDDRIVDDSIFEDFIRRNREQFVREKEEAASVSIGKQGSSGHYVMDDWIFEDFIRRNRNRFQYEKEEIISIDDYSDDELDDSVSEA